MKKIAIYLMMTCLSLTFIPLSSNATNVEPSSTLAITKTEEKAHAEALISRLHEIKAMNRSNMSASEKKSMRKEVRAIKHELEHSNGGIYLSVGAVIIIVLLLIILL